MRILRDTVEIIGLPLLATASPTNEARGFKTPGAVLSLRHLKIMGNTSQQTLWFSSENEILHQYKNQ